MVLKNTYLMLLIGFAQCKAMPYANFLFLKKRTHKLFMQKFTKSSRNYSRLILPQLTSIYTSLYCYPQMYDPGFYFLTNG